MMDLGSLGGSYSEARGINDNGQIVGYSLVYSVAQHVFLYENGEMTDLGTFGSGYPESFALPICGANLNYK